MDSIIRFAYREEEDELREIMLSFGMDLAGDIEDHVIVIEGETISAGGRLSLIDRNTFHLEVLGVRNDRRRTGAGRLLLSRFLSDPWEYCQGEALGPDECYKITTVSRGEAVAFYAKMGFIRCDYSDLEWPYNEQCETCPDAETCKPVPMVYRGGGKECSTP